MTELSKQIAYFNELYEEAKLPETWVITDKNGNPQSEIDLKNYARIGFKFGMGYMREQEASKQLDNWTCIRNPPLQDCLCLVNQCDTGSVFVANFESARKRFEPLESYGMGAFLFDHDRITQWMLIPLPNK